MLVEVTDAALLEIVCENRVVEVEELTQMRVNNEGPVVDAEVFLARNLNLHLTELLANGRTARVEVVVHILNVEHDEFGQSLATEHGLEAVLPVRRLVNLERLHRLDVHNMNELTDLVHENHGSDTAHRPRERLG